MSMTDPIADMLARIRNASMAMHDDVFIPASRIKKNIAQILTDEGFVKGFEVVEDGAHPMIRITLSYTDERERAISGLRRISKPGRRVYRGAQDLPRGLGGMGVVAARGPFRADVLGSTAQLSPARRARGSRP